MYRLSPRFGVGKHQYAVLRINVLPLKREDFTQARSRKRKQTDGGDGPRRCGLIPLRSAQGISEACQFGLAQKPLTTVFAVFSTCRQGLKPSGRKPCFSAQLKNFESRASVRLA